MIEAIYRDTFEAVRRAAGRVLGEPADRDGVVHEVFTELCSSRRLRDSFRGGDVGAWLAAIARHRALDFARRERRLVDLDSAPPLFAADDPIDEFRRDLERFAGTLPAERRRLLELRFVEGLTQVEAAARMGVPRSTLEDWERALKRGLAAHLAADERRGKAAV